MVAARTCSPERRRSKKARRVPRRWRVSEERQQEFRLAPLLCMQANADCSLRSDGQSPHPCFGEAQIECLISGRTDIRRTAHFHCIGPSRVLIQNGTRWGKTLAIPSTIDGVRRTTTDMIGRGRNPLRRWSLPASRKPSRPRHKQLWLSSAPCLDERLGRYP